MGAIRELSLTLNTMAKKQSKPTEGRNLDASEMVAALLKEYGANAAVTVGQTQGMEVSYFSTGVVAIDMALRGGWPRNRISELFGGESSFKTTLTMLGAAAFQDEYDEGQVYFIDAERSLSKPYLLKFPLDLDRFHVVNSDYGEMAVDQACDIAENASGDILLVIDSIAGLVPKSELEGSAEQATIGVHPRLINRLMRGLMQRTRVSLYDAGADSFTVIALNQTREKVGVLFGDPETTPGGKGKNFTAGVRMRLSAPRSKAVKEKLTRGGITQDVRVAQTVNFLVHKNKCGGPQWEGGEFLARMSPVSGILSKVDNIQPLIRYGLFTEVIDSGYYWRGIGGSKKKLEHRLAKDLALQERLRRAILDAFLAQDGSGRKKVLRKAPPEQRTTLKLF